MSNFSQSIRKIFHSHTASQKILANQAVGICRRKPLVISSGENAKLSWRAWKQMELYVQLSCPCGGRGHIETVVCSHQEMVKFNSCCYRCCQPLSGEVIFA